ncbi:hypothetical protein [Arsenicibacter rosenii]|uniref:Uncharacterized protein n=1 Tax=Arsenicibacter rosenii TaxID=1750698 RepID=A0A1S2VDL4_9BACT|nr:hypothetical protein [Arsenicibacter rosenii]OIN56814.1 hypothetical protein BLX24_22835 [Arsenicibacter rosenii]
MSTLQQHYERLRQTDLDRWNEMNSVLVRQSLKDGNCLIYFERSVLGKERKNPEKIDLRVLPGWILHCLVGFLGFTWEDIWSNRIPELEQLELEIEKAG